MRHGKERDWKKANGSADRFAEKILSGVEALAARPAIQIARNAIGILGGFLLILASARPPLGPGLFFVAFLPGLFLVVYCGWRLWDSVSRQF
jgi:hypothetical protein